MSFMPPDPIQVGVVSVILNIEVYLWLIHTYSTFVTPFSNTYSDSPWRPLSEPPLICTKTCLLLKQI